MGMTKAYSFSWERDRLGSLWLASRQPAECPNVLDDSPFGEHSYGAEVFGETPKTAVETTALPKHNCMVTAKDKGGKGGTPCAKSNCYP
jgi:hypothetical protein